MSVEMLNNPEAELNENEIKEREKKIADLFEQGLDSPDIMAYHGTSLEAINELIKTGYLPTGKIEGGIDYLYFFRLDKPVPESWLDGETEKEHIQRRIEMYARDLAFEASLCRTLGLDFSKDKQFLDAMGSVAFQHQIRVEIGRDELKEEHLRNSSHFDAIIEYLNRFGFPAIKAAFDESFGREGVIIGINSEILKNDPQSAYDELDDEGWRANLPKGLPLEYISGIEPIGQPEYGYFEALQEKHAK